MASKRTEPGAIGGEVKKKTKRKKVLEESGFKHYLDNASLVKDFALTKNGNLSFHWANWKDSCQYQKEYLHRDISNEVKLIQLNDELGELKKTEIWLKNKRGCMKMSLYDVYEGYLDNRLRMTWFERDGILMSFENEAGPYISLANMKWFNKKIYAAFMFRKLLTQPIPFRGFRVGLNVPVKCCFDNSPLNTAEFNIHQATEYGIIMKVDGKNNLSKIKNSNTLQLEIDLTPFIRSKGFNYKAMLAEFEKYDFNSSTEANKKMITLPSDIMTKFNNDRNALSGGEAHFYFFVPYSELFKEPHHKNLHGLFNKFVEEIKTGLGKEMKKVA